ncbi:putative transcription initiation factor TFIIE, beta subunit, TFA2, Winged helix domain 2 [Helianthus annuus]|nr:putative transcription initiation factor TFIIE, beta subunit, TFA2, Winged helix domain 2 [Helianthus annuus]
MNLLARYWVCRSDQMGSSLKEKLNTFNRQQEKCQSDLTSIAASTRTPPAGKSPVPAVRLQLINNKTRKTTVGAQIKCVIDLLYKVHNTCLLLYCIACACMHHQSSNLVFVYLQSRQSFTAEQINEACYVDVKGSKAVFESLTNNPKVNYDGRCFSYKSKHSVRDQKELLRLIQTFAEGIAVADLKDAYPTVMEDLQVLKAGRQIWLLSTIDAQKEIAYPNDPRVPIKVDDELKQLFRSIKLPPDMLDIEQDIQKNGMKPATNTAKRIVMAQNGNILVQPKQEKKTGFSKRTKLTNSHLPELFQT